MDIFLNIVILLFLDIILSIDNAILIASVTKDLDNKNKKIAQWLGGFGAIFLRLVFIILVIVAIDFMEEIPIIYILGGAFLIYIGFFLTIKNEKEEKKTSHSNSILKSVLVIIGGDIMLSFDNAFIIGDIVSRFNWDNYANIGSGFWINVMIITIALLISFVIIINFSSGLSKLLVKNEWILFVASWLLITVGIELILQDYIWSIIFGETLEEIFGLWRLLFSYGISGIVVFGKWYFIDYRKNINNHNNSNNNMNNDSTNEISKKDELLNNNNNNNKQS